MSGRASCDEVRELAPELALGIASGEERARALAHIATCPACRRFISELSATADEVLLLAPQREPAAGFENRVLAAIGARRRPRRLVLGVAAGLMAAVLGGGAIYLATAEDRELAARVRETLAEANGKYFSVLPLKDESGTKVANVFAYEGHPSWLFIVWKEPLARGDYEVEAELVDGDSVMLGTFEGDGTRQTWGGPIPGSLHSLDAIEVLAPKGAGSIARFSH